MNLKYDTIMTEKKYKMNEKENLEKELSRLMEITLRLENELMSYKE
jgi:hypothetical protein